MIRYTYISKSFSGPGGLDADKTVCDLVNTIARQTTLTGEQIEKRLLDAINQMIADYQPKGDK